LTLTALIFRNRKPILMTDKQKVELHVDNVQADQESATGVQTLQLTLRYEGDANLQDMIRQGEMLSIEIPSHAPPPESQKD
jgi:hypothetical protein